MRGRRGGRGAAARRSQDAQETRRTRLGSGIKAQSGGGGIFKTAAVGVLRLERKLMTTGEITKVALDRGLIKCQGKTPEATMASALYTDVKRKHDKSVFTRPQEGLFGLREWINEGFFPEGWVGPTDGLGLAPFKKRNSVQAKAHRSSTRSTRSRPTQSWRDATSDLDDAGAETDTDDEDDEMGDEEETEDLMDEDEMEEEDSPKPRSGGRGRGRGRDVSTGAGGSRTTTTRSHEVYSSGPGNGSRMTQDEQDAQDAQDALESPLHILGDVAETQGQDDDDDDDEPAGRREPALAFMPSGGGKRKRRMSGLQMDGGGDDTMMPRSPLEDSLAALHEIATSPSTYAPSNVVDAVSRRKARPSLGLGDLGGSLMPNLGTQSSLANSLSMFQGLDGGFHPLMTDQGALLLQGLDASRAPLLGMPSLAGAHLLEAQNLLPMHDQLPTTPDMLAAAMSSAGLGSLISPGWNPRTHMDAAAALAGRLHHNRRASEGLAALLQLHNGGMMSGGGSLLGSLAAAAAPAPRQGTQTASQPRNREYGAMTAQQAADELAEIARMRAVVERLEARMGHSNPQVGKAWLSLARMYQHAGGSAPEAKVQAAEALARARAVCRRFCLEQRVSPSAACEEGFEYLAAHMRGTAPPAATAGTAQPHGLAEQRQGQGVQQAQQQQAAKQQQPERAQHKDTDRTPQLKQTQQLEPAQQVGQAQQPGGVQRPDEAQQEKQERTNGVEAESAEEPRDQGSQRPPPLLLQGEPSLALDLLSPPARAQDTPSTVGAAAAEAAALAPVALQTAV